ncbi:MAG TPA: hypothetical protein VI522_08210 [Gammaproteobacteria bacterium]|nr:hypothetical protein [Gammaproteobacteria bacterium]
MFKKLSTGLLFLFSAVFFNVSAATQSQCVDGTHGTCALTFLNLPAITAMPCGGMEQFLVYTIKNNLPVSLTIEEELQILSGNSSSGTVAITGGTCGGLSSFILPGHGVCTIEVTITSDACPPPKQAPKAVSQIAQVLALIPTVTDTGVAEKARSSLIDLLVTEEGSQIAYVTNLDSSSIAICPVNADGSLAACASDTDPSFFSPRDIILNNDATIAYVANDDNIISICHIHPDGTLGTCSAFSDPNGNLDLAFTGLRLNSENTLLYATGVTSRSKLHESSRFN